MNIYLREKTKNLKRCLAVVLTIVILFTSLGIEKAASRVQAATMYTTIYLKDDTAEHWLGNNSAIMEMVDNTSGHDHYIMTKVNSTTWSVRVPVTTFNVTFNRLSPDGSTQWNSWSAGGRGSNRDDMSTWHSTYHATVPEHGYWDGEAEYEEGFHEGDVIYLDYYEFANWEISNAVFYVNFTNASKEDNNGTDVDISSADTAKFSPIRLTDEIEEQVFTYTVTAEDEGATHLRFWRGNNSTLWNYSVTLSYEDYKAGNNCVKVQGWNNTGYVCPYVPRRHIPVFDTIELNITGNQKVNRKITVDFDIQGETEYLNTEDTEISIVKTDSDGQVVSDTEEYLIYDTEASDWNHRELIFTESGTYRITATATDGTDYFTDEKIINVVGDNAPVALITLNNDADMETFVRNSEGILELIITDSSVSEMNDVITERNYYICYDADNDGEYEEDEIIDTITGNETEVSLQLEMPGSYQVKLAIKEEFYDTIPKLITDEAYLRSETEKTFEIVNQAPVSSMNVRKSKIADIIFTLGSADSTLISEYAAATEAVKDRLEELGIEANVSTVSTSALTATDTFAWREYDHYNYSDRYRPTLPKHIIYSGKDIKMTGYSVASIKDFLYVADDNSNRKVFEFDIQRDYNNWHSMEGGGFLFNTIVSEEENYIQGYCVLVTQSGLRLIKINRTNLSNFRNGGYNETWRAGYLIRTFGMSNLYDNHHLKIIVDGNTLTVYDGDILLVNEFQLPDDGIEAYGYGPITSHLYHDCNQQSYFVFKNISMQTITGESLSDVINSHKWTPGENHYVINLSEMSVPELMDNDRMSELSASLISNDVSFYGIGNEKNINRYNALLNSINGAGENLELTEDKDNIETIVNQIVDSIIADINSKDYEIKYVISSDEKVEYTDTFNDPDGDEKGEEEWIYEYNPDLTGAENENIRILNLTEPITMFSTTGAYTVSHRVKDSVGEYSLWSDEDDYRRLILSQHRPVADIDVTATQSDADSNVCLVNVQYSAYDEDHMDDASKGIRKEEFYYKEINDTGWTEGRFPAAVAMGTTYLIKYVVTDVEGTVSRPKVVALKTAEARKYVEPVDNTPPTIKAVVSDKTVETGDTFYIEASAEDDFGIKEFSIKHGDSVIGTTYGRFACYAEEAGEYNITVYAEDFSGNTAVEEIRVKVIDNSDVTPPTIKITSPANGTISGNTDIIGTITDDKQLKSYTVTRTMVTVSDEGYEPDENTSVVVASGTDEIIEDVIVTIDADELESGIYRYEIRAEDMAGHGVIRTCIVQVDKDMGDTIPPEVYITNITFDKNSGIISIYGTVSDNIRIEMYELYLISADGEIHEIIASGNDAVTDSLIAVINTADIECGTYELILRAEDTEGNIGERTAEFTYTRTLIPGDNGETEQEIHVNEDLEAPVILAELQAGITENGLELNINGTINDENLLSYSVVTGKIGEDGKLISAIPIAEGTDNITDSLIAQYTYDTYGEGEYAVIITAADVAGNTRKARYSVTINSQNIISNGYEGEDDSDSLDLIVSQTVVGIGETVEAYITYPKSAVGISVTAGNAAVTLKGRTAEIVSGETGEITVVLSAVINGETKTVEKTIRFIDRTDRIHPEIEFITPEPGSDISEPTDIVATITDETSLAYYILEYRFNGDGQNEYHEISRGTEQVVNESIGKLDTTLLMNGNYSLRITAADNGGNRYWVERTINVTGNLKVGNMSIGFNDIISNVSGIPLMLTRNYDSRNKSSGDFGTGWTMGIQSARLIESTDIMEGYELIRVGSRFETGYYLTQTENHDIIVTYGDGTSDRFELKVTPERSALMPIYEVRVNFRCVTDSRVKLELDGENYALVSGENLVFEDPDMLNSHNYILTRADGTRLYLSPDYGILKIEDNNGNTVSISTNGYIHSSGNSIIFTRDDKGRIIRAEEKNSDSEVITSVTYTYDSNDNLVTVTDKAGRTVMFTYDDNHNLTDIIDPSGIAVARNIYDENGRLVAIVDADGNRIDYIHDIDGRTEIVRDARGNATVYTYDDKGNVLSVTDALGNTVRNTYNENNDILTSTDANGNTTTYSYDDNRNLLSYITAEGNVETIGYNSKNIVTGISFNGSELLALDYDDRGNLTSMSDALGNETELTYTSDGRLTGITDSIGTVQALTYDENDRLISMTDGNGNVTRFNYNSAGLCTGVTVRRTDSDGVERDYTSVYTYDSAGNITMVTSPAGDVTRYEYDFRNNRTAAISSDGRRTAYTYDSMNNLTMVTYPDGTTESFTYDACGNVVTATGRMGITAGYTYDSVNRLTGITYADGTSESYTYDACGNVLTHTSVKGGVTVYTYDCMNRNTSVTDALGNVTTFEYNDRSLLTKQTDALGNEFNYEYDANGNQTKIIYPDGAYEEAEYDARGRIISVTDRAGNTTSYAYDNADNLISVEDAAGGVYTYTYDETYELTAVMDALGNTTSYEYDADGRLIKVTNAAGYSVTYTYDEYGYITGVTDYAGHTVTYIYDENRRIIRTTDSDGSTLYNYDSFGRIISVTDAQGVISYTYDEYGRLESKTTYDYGTIRYTYDEADSISSITAEVNGTNVSTTSYYYDIMERVVRVVGHDGSATLYEYDAIGNRTAVRHEGGLTVNYQYDECSRLINERVTDTDGSVLIYYGYEYGSAGEKTAVTEVLRNTAVDTTVRVIHTEYEYDSLLRLTAETIRVAYGIPAGTIDFDDTDISTVTWSGSTDSRYTYDAVSNRTSKTVTITGNVCGLDENIEEGTTAYTYNSLNQLTSSVTGGSVTTAYTYDLNGNLLSEHGGSTDKTYTYDAKNRLITATISSGNGVTNESYAYDYEGNRISRQVNEEDRVYYFNDTCGALTQTVLELGRLSDGTYEVNKYYTRGTELISADIRDDDTFTKKLYIQDGHGSVTALASTDVINGGSVITDTYVYDAYGILLKKTGDTDNSYLYTGELYDEATGLYYLRARYMSPETGTFISMDSYAGSLDNPVSLHKYLYANANPVMYTDPSGYFSLSESMTASSVYTTLQSNVAPILSIKKIVSWVNLAVTVYDVSQQVMLLFMGQTTVKGLATAIAKGMVKQVMLNCALKAVLGEAAEMVLKVIGLAQDMDSFVEAVKSGDRERIFVESLRLAVSLFTLKCQCFTGDTLVDTEDGYRRIDEIEAGDYVWAYNSETGECELKEVLSVSVTDTDVIVHVMTSDGEEIRTTMYHPFYVKDEESGKWKAASNLVRGDLLLTENGEKVYVKEVRIEKSVEPVKVYNLEVDELHTYFVAGGVLVHNMCSSGSPEGNGSSGTTGNNASGTSSVAKPNQGQGFSSKGYNPQPGERTFEGYVKQTGDPEISLYTKSSGFNNNLKGTGGQFKRFGANEHYGLAPHVHQPVRNVTPNGMIFGRTGKDVGIDVFSPNKKDIKQLYEYLNNGKYHE